jgi:3'-5' exoribonuclease
MVIELEMLHAKIALVPGFPADLKTLIEHLIISHHGHYEFGSPKLPMFPEALVLHYLDDLDSKMESMRAHFEREAGSEGAWTSYNASLGRPLLDAAKLLDKKDDAKRDDSRREAESGAGKTAFQDSEETDSAEVAPSLPGFDPPGKGQEPTSVTVAGAPEKI